MYHVHRSRSYPNGYYTISITRELEHVGPDMLSEMYSQEGRHENPIMAVEAALQLHNIVSEYVTEIIFYIPGNDDADEIEMRDWAAQEYFKLKKCEMCNDILDKVYFANDYDGCEYCEYCVEMAMEYDNDY